MKNNEEEAEITENKRFQKAGNMASVTIGLSDFINILLKKIGPLYQIDCIGLILYDETVSNISAAYIAEIDMGTQHVVSQVVEDQSAFGQISKEIAGFQFPVIKSRKEWIEEFGENHCVSNKTDTYIHHCYIPLEIDNKILGTLGIHNVSKELSSEGLVFCSNVADILAESVSMIRNRNVQQAVDEITSNQELTDGIVSRLPKQKFEVLLDLSIYLSTVKNKCELMRVIKPMLLRLGLPGEAAIGIIGQPPGSAMELLFPDSFEPKHTNSFEIGSIKDDASETLIGLITSLDEPSIINIHDLADLTGAFAKLVEHHQTIHDYIGVNLRDAGCITGVLILPYEQRALAETADIQIIKSVAQQISFAVSNLLKNERWARREKDKEILLALGSDLSKARNKDDIDFILHRRISQVLDYGQLVVRLLSPDKKTHSIYLSSIKDFKGFNSKELIVPGIYSGDDYLFTKLKQTEEPLLFDLNELVKTNATPDYLSFWHANGIRQVIVIPLLSGKELCGMLLINIKQKRSFSEENLSLLKGIAGQVSIAITNVLAYEKINNQLDEINAYKEQLEEEKVYLQEELSETANYGEIIGNGTEMKTVFNLLSQVSDSETTVLILGETGTGKELIARALHNNSKRKSKPMIKVNCAAIPANLIESELFGHEKGSFTGATERRIGKFELADKSTIFLDEIGELPMELQVKLLRVLQEKEFERVGGRATLHTDVRIISATNRNLQEEVDNGKFRTDLFYRLNVFPIKLPPLRERMEDLPVLADHFLSRYSRKAGKSISGFSNRAIQNLKSYHWPGNIRELEHLIERHVLLTKGQIVTEIRTPSTGKVILSENNEPSILKTLFENEREYIFSVLQHCNGRVSGPDGAAKILGLPATTLNSKIKKLGLTKTHLT